VNPARSVLRCGALALVAGCACFTAPRAAAQVDTIEVGFSPLGPPVVASVPSGDLAPLHGAVHLAYRRGPELRHAWKIPDPWQVETVADSPASFDLAVRGDGLAVLAFADVHGRLICAERGPSSWAFDTVATYPGSSLRVSVALSYNAPAIAFFESPSSGPATLRYALKSGASWTVTEMDPDAGFSGAAPWPPSLAIGPQGRPAVAFMHGAATLTGQQLVLLEGAGELGPFTSAVVDSEAMGPVGLAWDLVRQRPMMNYGARRAIDSQYEYRFAYRDVAGAWPRQVLGYAVEWFYTGVSLALDVNGTPGALWQDYQYLGPNLIDEVNGCGSIGTGTLQLSRQPAAAPSAPFASTALPRAFAYDTRISSRAVGSHAYGTFDVAWREPWSSCAPYAVLYAEVAPLVTGVPLERRVVPGNLALAPNPLPGGAALRVRWTQSRAAEARLEAHDLTGRRVATIVAGPRIAGEHEWSSPLPGLSPGLYWVSLVLDGERSARGVLVRR